MDTSALLKVVALVAALYALYNCLSLHNARRKFKAQHGCEECPKYRLSDPILGSDELRRTIRAIKTKRLLEDGAQRLNDIGNTYLTSSFLSTTFRTAEPENIKALLSTKFSDFQYGDRTHTHHQLLGEGIFAVSGKKWVQSRTILRPNFAREQVADIAVFEKHMQKFFGLIPPNGETVNLQDLFFKLTMDSATEFLFGESCNSLGMTGMNEVSDSLDSKFSGSFYTAQAYITKRVIVGPLARFWGVKNDEEEACRICHAYVDRFVEVAVQSREKPNDEEQARKKYIFLYQLAKATKDKKRLRDELLNILLAGRDTTAGLLSNLFFLLARRPDIWAKIRAEVETLDGRLPTYKDLQDLRYTRWCLNESLRTHPVVPLNRRIAMRDTLLPVGGGINGRSPVFVPKGSSIAFNVYALHREKTCGVQMQMSSDQSVGNL